MPVARIAHSLVARIRRFHEYHRTVAELSSLGDRGLADLGIARSEIRAVARRALA